jgi:hypothetical protein
MQANVPEAQACPQDGCATWYNGCGSCNCNEEGQMVACVKHTCSDKGPEACVRTWEESTTDIGVDEEAAAVVTTAPASVETVGLIRTVEAYQASSTCSASAQCSEQMAVDGNINTAWVTKNYYASLFSKSYAPATNAWLRLDLQDNYLVSTLRVYVFEHDFSSTIHHLTVSVCSSRECQIKTAVATVEVSQTRGWQEFAIPTTDARYIQLTAEDAWDGSHVISLQEVQLLGRQFPMPGPKIPIKQTVATAQCGTQACVRAKIVDNDVRTTFITQGMSHIASNMYTDILLPRAHDLMSVGIFVNSHFLKDTVGQIYMYAAQDSSYQKFASLASITAQSKPGWQFFSIPHNPEVRYLRIYTRDVAAEYGEHVYFETAFFGQPSDLDIQCQEGSVPVTSNECSKCEANTYAYHGPEHPYPYCRDCPLPMIAPARGSTRCVMPAKNCSHTTCKLEDGSHDICRTHENGVGKSCHTVSYKHIHTLHHSAEAHGELVTCAYDKAADQCECTCIESSVPRVEPLLSGEMV